MSSYTINLEMMKYLDLLDDLPYKDIKHFIHNEYFEDYYIDIEHLECDRIAYCETKITFTITINDIDKTFEKILYYNNSSGIALAIMEIQNEDDNEEEQDNEEEDNEEEIEDNMLSRAQ